MKTILSGINKRFALLVLSTLICSGIYAQDAESLAKSNYMNAESSYDEGKLDDALGYLKKTEQYLGKNNSKIQYLRVKIWLAACNDYKRSVVNWEQANKELKLFFEITPKGNFSEEKYNEMLMNVALIEKNIGEVKRWVINDDIAYSAAIKGDNLESYNMYAARSEKNATHEKNINKLIELQTNIINARAKDIQNGDNGLSLAESAKYANSKEEEGNALHTKAIYLVSFKEYALAKNNCIESIFAYMWRTQEKARSVYIIPDKSNEGKLRQLIAETNQLSKMWKVGPLSLSVQKMMLPYYLEVGLCQLASIENELKNYKDAIEYSNIVILNNPKFEDAYYNRAKAYGNLNNFASAITDLTKAIELNRESKAGNDNLGVYYYWRARAKNGMKNYKGAIEDWDERSMLKPGDAEIYSQRAWSKSQLKDYAGAITDLTKAISLEPTNLNFLANRGYYYRLSHNYMAAINDYSTMINQKPDYAGAYTDRAFLKQIQKDYTGAIEDYSKSISINSKDFVPLYHRAKIRQLYFKDAKTAKPDFETVIKMDSGKTVFSAFCYHFLGNDARTISYMNDRIAKAAPDSVKLKSEYYDAACLYSLMNNKTEALAKLEAAFKYGYNDFEWAESDDAFENITNTNEFKNLINKAKHPKNEQYSGNGNQSAKATKAAATSDDFILTTGQKEHPAIQKQQSSNTTKPSSSPGGAFGGIVDVLTAPSKKETEVKVTGDSSETNPGYQVYTTVETMPEFPGGEDAMNAYFKNQIKYPESALKDGVSGTVYVTMIISWKGKVESVKILKGKREDIDNEAIRVIRAMPDWKPGMNNGKPVNVQYNIPVSFSKK